MSYFGADDQPCTRIDGYSVVIIQINERGERVEAESRDNGERRVMSSEGYCRIRVKFDNDGNAVDIRLFDIADQPCQRPDGIARWTVKYDAAGRRLSTTFFDLNDQVLDEVVMITGIVAESQAARLGIQVGDQIVSYDGKPIAKRETFIGIRKAETADRPPRDLVISRDGVQHTFSILPGQLGVNVNNQWIPKRTR